MKMTHLLSAIVPAALAVLCACGSGDEPTPTPPSSDDNGGGTPATTVIESVTSDLTLNLATDRCSYKPGDKVQFSVASGNVPSGARVRYRHLGTIVADEALSGTTWTWTVPATDFQGYLAEVYSANGKDAVKVHGTIGIDVSSDWTRFPRYGFVATFDASKTDAVIADEVKWLNRCHINGVQFQDWHLSHHWPCPVTKDGQLMAEFKDIANRTNLTSVVRKYIDVQHGYGMKTMFYNLAFGALSDAEADGVKDSWYLFKEANHAKGARDSHDLPSSWKSNIYLVNPGNAEWQRYIGERNDEVYRHFDFDGYQIDQLGYRGDRYDYSGNKVNLPQSYQSFIKAMHARHPEKRLVMNAVSGYGTQQIVGSDCVDFLYNEVWGDQDKYDDLYKIVRENNAYSKNALRTVFAAYMDYNRDNCEFNIPGILMTDAVMFALGATHLELGDHMLCREYFPYTGVRMSQELRTQMERYYDFLVAYENLLMDEGSEAKLLPTSTTVKFNAWPPVQRQVTALSREVNGRQVVHLLNFINATSLSWRDMDGTQAAAKKRTNIDLTLDLGTKKATRVWAATPDEHAGAPVALEFKQEGTKLTLTLPSLKYWTMLVIE